MKKKKKTSIIYRRKTNELECINCIYLLFKRQREERGVEIGRELGRVGEG